MEEEEFLTVKEAAEWLGVCVGTIYAMVRQGRLKHYPIGWRLSFRRTHIEQLMEDRKLLTVNEVANLLLVHTSTIHLMVRKGRLRAYRIGERLRFRREDINALLRR